MNQHQPDDRVAETDQRRAASGFFAHHGMWARGVRLFRQTRFAAKVTIISLAFILPILALLVWQIKVHADDALQARKAATGSTWKSRTASSFGLRPRKLPEE